MMCIRTFRFTQMHVGCENPRLEPPSPFSEWSKSAPEGSQIDFGRTKIERKAFCRVQQPSRRVQDVPRARQERAKSAPRAPQECSKSAKSVATAFQCAPKSTQLGPKSPHKGPWRALGDHFKASNLDRGAFRKRSVARRAQEWFLKDFFDNFSLVRASDEPHLDS